MRNTFIIFFIFITSYNTIAQVPDNLYLALNNFDQRKIEKAASIYNQAKAQIGNAINYYENIPYLADTAYDPAVVNKQYEALRKLIVASNSFSKANKLAYEVYSKEIDKFWKTHSYKKDYSEAIKQAKDLQKQAQKSYEVSQLMRDNMPLINDFMSAVKKHNVAYQQEVISLHYSGRALKRYQDFPGVFDYAWSNKLPFEEWNVKLPVLPMPDIAENNTNKEIVINSTPTSENKADDYDISYRIQIAAHTIPISQANMKEIYPGNREVTELKEDGWYKYQIGPFKSFAEALLVLNEVNVLIENAFINAFNKDEKIPLRVAKEKAP